MSLSAALSSSAYARHAKDTVAHGIEESTADPGNSFADMVGESMRSAIHAGREAEGLSALGIAGKADLNDVVTAVNNAEITLQTVLAILDRVVQAYQDILRMPI